MALTLVQENALLALLDEPLVTLNELPKTVKVEDEDLFLSRQDTREKAVTGSVMKDYFASAATLLKRGTVQLTSAIDSDSEEMAVTPKALKQTYQLAELHYPVGAPIPWPSVNPPSGYLKCNGASFNKALYPKLAQAYPNGILPDLRGEFIRGWDDGRGVDAERSIISLQYDTMQRITGGIDGYFDFINSSGAFTVGNAGLRTHAINNTSSGNHSFYFDSSISTRTSNETRPRNIAFLYIVRAA